MSEPKWTKGEWKWIGEELVAGVENSSVLAAYCTAEFYTGDTILDVSPDNANLIAAAPDLADVLALAVRAPSDTDRWIPLAQSALAKARGEGRE